MVLHLAEVVALLGLLGATGEPCSTASNIHVHCWSGAACGMV